MHLRSATKVGLAVVISVGAYVLIWYFLLGQGLRSRSYPLTVVFRDAQNLTSGAAVRMAGVQIGVVGRMGDDAVEPFADRHAGPPRRLLRDLACRPLSA